MSHTNHRAAFEAKRSFWQEAVDEDDASHDEALLAADQQREREQPAYHEQEKQE